MVGNLVSGKRIAQASGRDLGQTDDNDQFLFLSEVLQWRAQTTPDHILYTLLSSRGAVSNSLTCLQLHKRAERVASLLMERGGLQEGDHNIATTLPTVKMIVEMSHNAVGAFCRSVKLQCELYPSREVAICLDPYCGLGFVLWCLCSQLKVRDTFCSYSVMELCTKGLGLQTDALKERPRMSLTHSFSKLFKDLGLHPRAGTSGPDPTTVYILPGIWVHSAHNGSGYYSGYGEEVLQSDHFSSRLSFGDTQTVWARTGYLGFLRRTELTDASGERHDALYVVGALEEAMELRGMRYHPIDIETSVIRTHKNIVECAVFPWTNLLVVVVELEGSEQEALDLVPMVTKAV
ncbi:hypothetical protein CRUP_010687, partial [Coryphaenoides rupestris]